MIREYLPGIDSKYYSLYVKIINNIIINPNETKSLLPTAINNQKGLLYTYILATNSNTLNYDVNLDGVSREENIEDLYGSGYTFYIPGFPFITAYDTSNNYYAVNLTFPDGYPFNKNMSVSAHNTTGSPVTIYVSSIELLLIKDGFYEELKKLL